MASELPVDIILEIYHWYLVSEDLPTDYNRRPILAMAAVCQRWRDVFTSIPSLWADVIFTSGDKFNFDAYLDKSFPLPYRVFLYSLPQGVFKPREAVRQQRLTQKRQVQAIANHVDRLQTLNFSPYTFYELKLCLPVLVGLTADNLREVHVGMPPVIDVTLKLPDPSPLFPKSPNLKHISSPGKCIYMYPSDLTALTTLDLVHVDWDLANFRAVFGSLSGLTTLSLTFSCFRELFDPLYAREIHSYEVQDLIHLPSLRYLSVGLPPQFTGQCSCLLPTFYFPNLEVLDISWRALSRQRDHYRPRLHHFHPRNVQAWNKPSSPFRKIRFGGYGWRWTSDIFTSTMTNPTILSFGRFSKLLDLEWVDDVLLESSVFRPDELETLQSCMRAKSNTVFFTRSDDLPQDPVNDDPKNIRTWLQSVRNLLDGPITAMLPRRLARSTELSSFSSASLCDVSVVFSDATHSIWDDVIQDGGDVPDYLIKAKRNHRKCWGKVPSSGQIN